MMLPPALKALRRALRETLPRPGRATPAARIASRCAETLERARAAEVDAYAARLTPAEFFQLYGYAPCAAQRMREAAELVAYSRDGGGARQRLDA